MVPSDIVISKIIRITLILDDHIVEYNTCIYHHTQFIRVHVSSKDANDAEVKFVEPQMLSPHLSYTPLAFEK